MSLALVLSHACLQPVRAATFLGKSRKAATVSKKAALSLMMALNKCMAMLTFPISSCQAVLQEQEALS